MDNAEEVAEIVQRHREVWRPTLPDELGAQRLVCLCGNWRARTPYGEEMYAEHARHVADMILSPGTQ